MNRTGLSIFLMIKGQCLVFFGTKIKALLVSTCFSPPMDISMTAFNSFG